MPEGYSVTMPVVTHGHHSRSLRGDAGGRSQARGGHSRSLAVTRGHYAATFGARGPRVERGVRHDVEAAREVAAVWLVGVQPRGHANV